MPFDSSTRNKLQKMVATCRRILTDEFTAQLQSLYGIQPTGEMADVASMTHLDDEQLTSASLLRERIDHLADGRSADKKAAAEAIDRVIREQAFTVLNRLAALRMCEERGIVQECIGNGFQSRGFQVYCTTAGSGLGDIYQRYRVFLQCLFHEISLDLGVLFDRFSPLGLLFPREPALLETLKALDDNELKEVWKEDEAIGWIYQYFNSKEEREAMRKASAAPRNSRELAVRNQFFTPRYVVEFLTDNTLGRIWYEMTKGETQFKEHCRYLVRRPNEVFLAPGEEACGGAGVGSMQRAEGSEDLSQDELLKQPVYIEHRPKKDPRDIKVLDPACGSGHFLLYAFDVLERIYEEAWDEQYAVCSRQYAVGSRQNAEGVAYGREELSGPDRVAESNGPCGNDLRSNEILSKGGNLRTYKPGPEGGGLHTIQHRGRPGAHDEERVPELSINSARVGSRSGDANPDRPTIELPADRKSRSDPESAMRSGSIDQRALELALNEVGYDYANSAYCPLPTAYSSKHDFLKRVPELILRHNIHGIDIDPRACQIAGLSLWLRAQRSCQKLGLKPDERPRITRANVVCAEPMPGEKDLLEEFIGTFRGEQRIVGELVREVWERMKLAGEAGSLLKIEEELREAIDSVRKEWEDIRRGQPVGQMPMWADRQPPRQLEIRIALGEIKKEAFWDQVEGWVLEALNHFAEKAGNGKGYQRKLFAEDAAQGFAFIDLCLKLYDVVLMNPPFGEASERSLPLLNRFGSFTDNIAAPFLERFLAVSRFVGMVMDRALLIRKTHEAFRRLFIERGRNRLCGFANYGWGVLDAYVEVAALVAATSYSGASYFLSKEGEAERLQWLFTDGFSALPNRAISGDVPSCVINAFARNTSLGESEKAARVGHQWKSERYLRLWWEGYDLGPYVYNGAPYSPYVFISRNRMACDPTSKEVITESSTVIRNQVYHYLPGVAYGKRGIHLDAHLLPKGQTFTVEGLACFPESESDRWTILAYLNSSPVTAILSLFCGQHKHVGYVNSLPFSNQWDLASTTKDCLQGYVIGKYAQLTADETSPLFTSAIDARLRTASWSEGFGAFYLELSQHTERLGTVQTLVNCDVAKWLRFPQDWKFLPGVEDIVKTAPSLDATDVYDESGYDTQAAYCSRTLCNIVGVVLGRWDVRIALEPLLAPKLAGPFDPLPVCPPAMLVSPNGLPAEPGTIVSKEWLRARPSPIALPPEGSVSRPTIPDEEYPLRVSWSGILVDDSDGDETQAHPEDIVHRTREVLDLLWGDRVQAIEQEACEILGAVNLRDYFRKPSGFFDDHLKRYSKSRRKAPIYWPLSTESGSYTLWIYYHRLTDQTLYQCVNDYVNPKLETVAQDIDKLRGQVLQGGTAKQRDQLERLQKLQQELTDFRAELLRVAALPYRPNLNDGVLITASPLWKLFRLPRWRKDLQECWKKLESGEYDWAHLAYSIWPERVKEKCKTDRSIAIAHDLEELFQEPKLQKKPKKAKTRG